MWNNSIYRISFYPPYILQLIVTTNKNNLLINKSLLHLKPNQQVLPIDAYPILTTDSLTEIFYQYRKFADQPSANRVIGQSRKDT